MSAAVAYAYAEAVQIEVEDLLRGALGPGMAFARRATLEDDYHGVDLWYVTSREVPIQIRMRYDRPQFAIDDDVSFRTTEPRMIAERTYAPLMAFGWLRRGRFVAGKLIDIYTMAAGIDPPLASRDVTVNNDGRSGFRTVSIEELFIAKALLRVGDRSGWANALSDSDERLQRVMAKYGSAA